MQCTKCGCATKVTQSVQTRHVVARKHKCKACGHTFTTQEIESAAGQLLLNRVHNNTNRKRKARKRFERACREAAGVMA